MDKKEMEGGREGKRSVGEIAIVQCLTPPQKKHLTGLSIRKAVLIDFHLL